MNDVRLAVLLFAIAGVLFGITLSAFAAGIVAYHNEIQPVVTVNAMCPEEDSCKPDYYNGQWHIVRLP